jgi:hypothetical protein
MNTKIKLTQFASLFLLMLVTGVFWGTWFTLTRSLENFQIEEFIHIGKVIIAKVAVPMGIIMPTCITFMIVSLWLYPAKKSIGFYFSFAALILVIVTLLVTLLVLVPIDNQIKLWTAATAPSNWGDLQMRRKAFHTIRTLTSLASFGCLTVSMIWQTK